MARINRNYEKLPGSYLFSEIARRTVADQEANPEARLIKMGIGDVTRPLDVYKRQEPPTPYFITCTTWWPPCSLTPSTEAAAQPRSRSAAARSLARETTASRSSKALSLIHI